MAVITTTEAADIIPKFWLNEVLNQYFANATISQMVRRDFANETGGVGDTINIPKRGSLTLRTKAEGSSITSDNPSNTKVAVVLDQHKYISWKQEDHVSAKALQQGLDYIRDAVPQFVESIDTALLNQYANATYAVGSAGTDMSTTTILAAREKMNVAKIPMADRHLIVSPQDDTALLGEELFVHADKRGDGGTAMERAMLGNVYGFQTYMSQLVPTTTGPDTRHNLAFHPDAMVLAVRPLPLVEPGTGARSAVVTDTESGISFRYTRGYSITEQATVHTIDILYGIKTLRPDNMVEVRA